MNRSPVAVAAALTLSLLVVACASKSAPGGSSGAGTGGDAVGGAGSVVLFPAPPDPMARAGQAGLTPNTHETLQHHVHAHLDVFVDGQHVMIPGGIGIDTTNPAVHRFTVLGQPGWGGISQACAQPCISPLHTHDISGILHTESPTATDNTLGEFFTEWGVPLTADCVATRCRPATTIAVYVNGQPFTGDPSTIPLTDHKEIAVVVGQPPAAIPSAGDFSEA